MDVKKLQKEALDLRIDVVRKIHEAKTGHFGGSLSIVELLIYIYNNEIILEPDTCNNLSRSVFVLSKGHASPVLYFLLQNKGIIDKALKLREFGSPLHGHPDSLKCNGIDVSTGSLGQGLSNAVGIAKAQKLANSKHKTICIVGDGEMQEGICYEALTFSAKNNLNNLVVIIDNNKFQLSGATNDLFVIDRIADITESIGLHTQVIDGHNFEEIEKSFSNLSDTKPNVIVANTIKGKGVSFMENTHDFHGKPTTDNEYKKAIQELEAKYESN